MEITRISANTLSLEHFVSDYFVPEKPVIITDNDLGNTSGEGALSFDNFRDHFGYMEENMFWHQTHESAFSDRVPPTPGWLRELLGRPDVITRTNNVRLWRNKAENLTSLHCDGHLLFVFNMQVIGLKRWEVYTPEDQTFSYYPFSNVAYVDNNQSSSRLAATRTYEVFQLHPGEILFLPPLHAHKVYACEDSINMNWVGTKRKPRKHVGYKRQSEIVKLLQTVSKFPLGELAVKRITGYRREYFWEFGGDPEFCRDVVDDVGTADMLKRLFAEVRHYPRAFADLREIKRRFRVDPDGKRK